MDGIVVYSGQENFACGYSGDFFCFWLILGWHHKQPLALAEQKFCSLVFNRVKRPNQQGIIKNAFCNSGHSDRTSSSYGVLLSAA
jgi:hypothetical protein